MVERSLSMREVQGSIPCISTFRSFGKGAQASLAQSVERKALNLVVVDSSPTVGVFKSADVGHCDSRLELRICHMYRVSTSVLLAHVCHTP